MADRCSRLGTVGNPRPEAEGDTDCRLEAEADKNLPPVAGAEGADSFRPGAHPGYPRPDRPTGPRVVCCSNLLDSARSRFERLFAFNGINCPVSSGVIGQGGR